MPAPLWVLSLFKRRLLACQTTRLSDYSLVRLLACLSQKKLKLMLFVITDPVITWTRRRFLMTRAMLAGSWLKDSVACSCTAMNPLGSLAYLGRPYWIKVTRDFPEICLQKKQSVFRGNPQFADCMISILTCRRALERACWWKGRGQWSRAVYHSPLHPGYPLEDCWIIDREDRFCLVALWVKNLLPTQVLKLFIDKLWATWAAKE